MYGNLKAEMGRHDITIESIAKYLNLHRNTVAMKLNTGRFFSDEAFKIQAHFFPNLSITYLFEQDSETEDENDHS